jgi:hypothetical protein
LEGHHINFDALLSVIVETVMTVLKKPVMEYCKGYKLEWDKMVVHEKSMMVDLSHAELVPQDCPYLATCELEFFKEKKGWLTHELTKSHLTFLLEILAEEFGKIEVFLDSLECEVVFNISTMFFRLTFLLMCATSVQQGKRQICWQDITGG